MAKVSRRQFVKGLAAGAVAAGALGAPGMVRKAYTAKAQLSVGLWNHWVPGATDKHKSLIMDWAAKNNVEVKLDFIGPQCRDIRTIASAESRAGGGHDVMAVCTFDAWSVKQHLEPLNEVADYLQGKYGKFDELGTYLSNDKGKWITIPAPTGSHSYPMVSRLDYFKKYCGVDLQAIFPNDASKRDKAKVDAWNYTNFLKYAKKLHAAGFSFGNPISETSDGNDWLCPLLLSFGSEAVNEKGDITIVSDKTAAALEYLKELTQYMPKEIYGWDDASNNRWIISGKGSCIQNPPSAWTVAKRTQPQNAAQMWHHDTPAGPAGRFRGALFYNFMVFKWSKEKKAAKELIMWLLEKQQQESILKAAQGYDMPQLKPMYDNPVWVDEGPPKGTVYNYVPRGDEKLIVGGWPANPEIGVQIYSKHLIPVMVAKATTGEMSVKDAMNWCAKELEMVIE